MANSSYPSDSHTCHSLLLSRILRWHNQQFLCVKYFMHLMFAVLLQLQIPRKYPQSSIFSYMSFLIQEFVRIKWWVCLWYTAHSCSEISKNCNCFRRKVHPVTGKRLLVWISGSVSVSALIWAFIIIIIDICISIHVSSVMSEHPSDLKQLRLVSLSDLGQWSE